MRKIKNYPVLVLLFVFLLAAGFIFPGCSLVEPVETVAPTEGIPTSVINDKDFALVRENNNWSKYDDTDEVLSYSGSWEVKAGSGYMDTLHYAQEEGAMVTFTTKGNRVKIYGSTGPDCGMVAFFINTQKIRVVDLYSKEPVSNVLLFDTGVMPTPNKPGMMAQETPTYVIMARVMANKNAESTGTGFYFDYAEGNYAMADNYFVKISAQNIQTVMESKSFKGTQHSDVELDYLLYVPEKYDLSQKYPLVTYLNNDIESNYNILCSRLIAEQESYPCFIMVVKFDELGVFVSGSPQLATLIELIDNLTQEYSIDSNRLIITGWGISSLGVWCAISDYPGKFSAAIPVDEAWDPAIAQKIDKTRIWAFDGFTSEGDFTLVLQMRDLIKAMRNAGNNPRYYEYAFFPYSVPDYAYREKELLEWMFQ